MPTINAIGTPQITLGGTFTMSGAYTFIGQLTGNTNVTFPTSGTLATTGGTVVSLQGTANQVLVNGTSGTPVTGTAITLSTPQNIGTGNSPTFVGMTLSAPILGVTAVQSSGGLGIVTFNTIASAVNYLTLSNQIAGQAPIIGVNGPASDISMALTCKGAGAFYFETTESAAVNMITGTAYQHATQFVFANTSASRIVTWPDADGTVAFTSGASGIVNPGLINQLAYYASAGTTLSGLTIANQGALTTDGTGVPAWVPMIAGQILIGTTSGAPVAAAINSGTNITVANGSGSITVNLSGVVAPTLGGTGVNNGSNTLTLAGNLATAGAFASTFTMTGATNVTFPTSGTLATTAGASGIVSSGLINQLAYYAAAGTTVSGVSIVNSAVLTTTSGGVPTWVAYTGSGAPVLGTSPTITTPRIAQINDTNGVAVLALTTTASAVNYLTVANSATGNGVQVSATGSDTNINLTLNSQGTGAVVARSRATSNQFFMVTGTALDRVSYLNMGATAGSYIYTFPDASGTVTLLGNTSTGTGLVVLANTPTLTTPVLGAATATSINFGGSTLSRYTASTSWVPTVVFAVNGDNSVSYNVQTGNYLVIGNLAIVTFNLGFSATYTTASGEFGISSVPFTPTAGQAPFRGTCSAGGITLPAGTTWLTSGFGTISGAFCITANGLSGPVRLTTTDIVSTVTYAISGMMTYFIT